MSRRSRRRRRRGQAVSPSFAGMLTYAAGLVLLNVMPGWQVVPILTADAAPIVALVNLALIVGLVGQALFLVDDRPRLRALIRYTISLILLVALSRAVVVFPFDLGSWGQDWATTIRLTLYALIAWDVWAASTAAVRMVQGRRTPRLAASHA